jgi:hypothetical protein
LEDWKLKELVRGLVFDTTAANTGLNLAACTCIEKAISKELIWIACCHHVFVVMLSAELKAALEPSSGPDVELLQRFRKTWPRTDKSNFQIPGPDVFDCISDRQRTKMLSFYSDALKATAPREDYRELLHLCYNFLGGATVESKPIFCALSALIEQGGMVKAIYS